MSLSFPKREKSPAGGLTGTRVLLILAAFFGVVGGVNAIMIHFALSTFRGEVGDHPYEVGLQFNNEIAASRAQTERRWRVDARLSAERGSRSVEVSSRDAEGRPLSGLTIRAVFAAPVDARLDRGVDLTETSAGRYDGAIPVAKGRWDLEIAGKRGGETLFQSRSRIELE